jgi:hypothetical protein
MNLEDFKSLKPGDRVRREGDGSGKDQRFEGTVINNNLSLIYIRIDKILAGAPPATLYEVGCTWHAECSYCEFYSRIAVCAEHFVDAPNAHIAGLSPESIDRETYDYAMQVVHAPT